MGIIYVLSNATQPSTLKIGQTDDLEEMIASDNDDVDLPFPYIIEAAIEFENPDKVEQAIQMAFAPERTHFDSKFFKIGIDRVMALLELANGKDVTPPKAK